MDLRVSEVQMFDESSFENFLLNFFFKRKAVNADQFQYYEAPVDDAQIFKSTSFCYLLMGGIM